MYHQPTIESLGDSQMSQVSGAFVWAVGPVLVAVAAVIAAVAVAVDVV